MKFQINVIENQYKDDHYRVSLSYPDKLQSVTIGTGLMGSAEYGILDEWTARHVARGIRLDIDLSQYDEITEELRQEVRDVTQQRLESAKHMIDD